LKNRVTISFSKGLCYMALDYCVDRWSSKGRI